MSEVVEVDRLHAQHIGNSQTWFVKFDMPVTGFNLKTVEHEHSPACYCYISDARDLGHVYKPLNRGILAFLFKRERWACSCGIGGGHLERPRVAYLYWCYHLLQTLGVGVSSSKKMEVIDG